MIIRSNILHRITLIKICYLSRRHIYLREEAPVNTINHCPEITGNLLDGTPIRGADEICIVPAPFSLGFIYQLKNSQILLDKVGKGYFS